MNKYTIRRIAFGLAAAIAFAGAALPVAADSPVLKTAEQAVAIALEETPGTLLKLDLDADDGKILYEVEVMDGSGYKHEFEIDAFTGDAGRERDNDKVYSYQQVKTVKVDWQTALQTAQDSLEDSVLEKLDLERSWSRMAYSIGLIDKAGYAHKVQVDAGTGEILSTKKTNLPGGIAPKTTLTSANKKALNAIGGGVVVESKLDYDDYVLHYDILAVSDGGGVYELKIDAGTGAVLKQERDD